MFKNIVIPLDGSALAAGALPYGQRLDRLGGHIYLLRAATPEAIPTPPRGKRQLDLVRLAESELAAVAQNLRAQGVTVEAHVYRGSPGSAVRHLATEHPVDLIVMSTHGRTGMTRLVMGSVAEEILRLCDQPVLLVSPHCSHTWGRRVASTVLVPLDGSPLSEEAIEPAQDLARQLEASLTLAQVIEPPSAELYSGTLYFAGDELHVEALAQEARSYLEPIADRLKGAVATEVRFGYAAATIAQIAEECDAEAIVMTTHGRTGFARMLFGSVASGVLQRAARPLLLVKPAAIRELRAVISRHPPMAVRGAMGVDREDIEVLRQGLELLLTRSNRPDDRSDRISHLLDRLAVTEATLAAQGAVAAPRLSA